jgi:hypothetical protein
MNDPQYQEALEEARRLTSLSDEALLEQLGLRVQDVEHPGGEERAQQYSADFTQAAEEMLSTEDLKKIGRRWWAKLEPALMQLVCTQNEEMGRIAGHSGRGGGARAARLDHRRHLHPGGEDRRDRPGCAVRSLEGITGRQDDVTVLPSLLAVPVYNLSRSGVGGTV